MAAFTTAQYYSASSGTGTNIPEYPTIKGIFADSGAWMQISAVAAPQSMDTITVEIPKSQVSMLVKKGDTIVYKEVNDYSMSVMTLSNLAPNQFRNSGVYRNKLNG